MLPTQFSERQLVVIRATECKMTSIFNTNNVLIVPLITSTAQTPSNNNNNRSSTIVSPNNYDLNSSIEEVSTKLERLQTELTHLTNKINSQPDTAELFKRMSELIEAKLDHITTPRIINQATVITNNSVEEIPATAEFKTSLSDRDRSKIQKQF